MRRARAASRRLDSVVLGDHSRRGPRVPWLYDGVPDRPAWLRRRAMRPSRREIRDLRDLAGAGPTERRNSTERLTRLLRRRSRIRRRAYNVLTDSTITFALPLVGGSLLALELDRLTDGSPGGSWGLLVLGLALAILGAWLARTRAVVEERFRESMSDQLQDTLTRALHQRLDDGFGDLEHQSDTILEEVETIRRLLTTE